MTGIIDIKALTDWLWTLEARGRYDGDWVTEKLESFGVGGFDYRDTEVSGMVLSSDLARTLAPDHYDGGYGGWGFQHQANVRAINRLATQIL